MPVCKSSFWPRVPVCNSSFSPRVSVCKSSSWSRVSVCKSSFWPHVSVRAVFGHVCLFARAIFGHVSLLLRAHFFGHVCLFVRAVLGHVCRTVPDFLSCCLATCVSQIALSFPKPPKQFVPTWNASQKFSHIANIRNQQAKQTNDTKKGICILYLNRHLSTKSDISKTCGNSLSPVEFPS